MKIVNCAIGLILCKSEKYLKPCLSSLLDQDYPNIEYLIRDQSPNYEAYDFIKKELPDIFNRIEIEKSENRWHSGGHNDLINKMSGKYYFCCSNDMWYPQNFVSSIVRQMEKPEYKKYGSATCKLMVWDFDKLQEEHDLEKSKTGIIDNCGIGIFKNHHFIDIGAGEEDRRQYDHKHEVFGPSGALAVFRKETLEDIAFKNHNKKEYFDELIHYKNDIDLAYRMQWAGHKCLFIPEIKVYHDRQAANKEKGSFWTRIIKGRKRKADWIRKNSFFGHQVILKKNYSKDFSLSVRLKTALYQFLKSGYILLFEPSLLKELKKLKKHKKKIQEKKNAMKIRVKPEYIEKIML